MTRILLIEDDENLAQGLAYNLEKEGYAVSIAPDGASGIDLVGSLDPDLVILDLMLPRRSGFDVLKALQDNGSKCPVMILSAQDTEVDKVRGFDLGAIDYVTKPFGLGELLARIRVRLKSRSGGDEKSPRFPIGNRVVDLDRFVIEADGESQPLTQTEVEILQFFRVNARRPIDRDELLSAIWGARPNSTRTLDTHIARLRRKIEQDPKRPRYLVTVHGFGYRLDLD